MKKSAAAIGVDIGGTSVKLGLVDSKGRILARDGFASGRSSSRSVILSELATHVRRLASEARRRRLALRGVGIGAPGPIDVGRGLVYFFPNLPGWKNTPLRRLLEKKLYLPVRLDNDANAMALGEFTFGAGKGVADGIALTLGTGVGGGIVLGGRLFHGPAYSAAEIGHLVVNEDGPRCGCGSRGCIETYVGNGYFVREVRRRLAAGQKSVLSRWLAEGRELSPYVIWQAAQKGDAFARRFWE
ncbi:MAG TPA: ROK family protein, partial [Thermomicrobiales bacterium]|nr:ROK family protein [Thermomicrobiales bacterium]